MVPLNNLVWFCQLSHIEAEVYKPPLACNNICPPSPVPPAGDGPTTNVFSVDPNDEVPTANAFVITTLWLSVLTNDDVEANEALTAFKIYEAVVALAALVANEADTAFKT